MRTPSGSWFLVPVVVVALAACGSDSKDGDGDTVTPPADTDTTDEGGGDTAPADIVDFDTRPADTGDDEVDTRPNNDFGEACTSNLDCDSGWCVEGPQGYICTEECLEECPSGYDCKSIVNSKGDVAFVCQPRVIKVCVGCLQDFQCNAGACLLINGVRNCASVCDENDDCPDGYTCEEDATREKEGKFCQPISGACDCSPAFEGVTRACTKTNDVGTCVGIETCDPSVGWVGCTARSASGETCDYVDNDCNGVVDDEFQTDGIYQSDTGCGSCTTSCDELLANTAETECTIIDGIARCQVVMCDPGYTMQNPFVCAPDVGNLCQECTVDAECLGPGAACTTLDDGDFCTRPCETNDDCAVGFICDDPEGVKQCVPESGSCTCDGSNTSLARSCEITLTPDDPDEPVVICKGFEQCTAAGWGGCDLPDDACDGIDNDCDGVIDGPHKTGDKYTSIENCGACGISCLALVRPNAAPACDASGPVPACTYACTGSAVDVNGRSDDGCECVPVAGPDLAGDDADSNCDGVDGEVDNAIFVSKDGDDANAGTIDAPVLTITVGLQKAAAQNKRDVYVATGVYSGSIELEEGVGLFGGYSPDFFEHDVLLFETAIIGGAPTAALLGSVTASGVGAAGAARETVLDGFTVFGTNAGNILGGSSYGVYVRDSGVRLRISENRIFGGPGGNGAAGTRGTDGANGIDGGNGISAKSLPGNCQLTDENSGGSGGTRSCNGVDVAGGNGGRSRCPEYETTPGTSGNGAAGKGTGAGAGGEFGWPLFICADDTGCDIAGFSCGLCYVPSGSKQSNASNGTNGTGGSNGSAGTAGSAGGSGGTGIWVGNKGGDGGSGTNGSGGGGGGAGGGVEVEGSDCSNIGNDDVSGSGAGGGSGGCLGTGGTGGLAGGGSFALFISGSSAAHTPVVTGNTLQGGRGGAGGNGGAGGVGGALGKGGSGGVAGDRLGTADQREATRCARAGGDGGNGGVGGHGGGGGGGAGGPSYALFASLPGAAPAEWKTNSTFIAGGQGGTGGNGGVSIDQTRSGANGAAGPAANANF